MDFGKYILQSDFNCVGLVAKHCDLQKMHIAIEESKTFDIIPLFCFDFFNDVLENWDIPAEIPNPDFIDEETTLEIPGTIPNPDYIQQYEDLINGGNYVGCNEKQQRNLGLKRVWVYYAYARYMLINQFNDTANGTVQKQNDFSIPTPLKEVTAFSNKYRAMGKEAYESVLDYLCQNKDLFPKFDDCNCKLKCGCSGKCSCGKTKKLSGFKFSTVRK